MTDATRRRLEDELRFLRRRLRELDGVETERAADVLDGAAAGESRELLAMAHNRMTRDAAAFEAALARLDAGTYGACEGCGDPIATRRLAAIPDAAYCTTCQNEREQTAARITRAPRRSVDPDEEEELHES